MEDFNKKDETAIDSNELDVSSNEADMHSLDSDLPGWYIDSVLQAMERTGEDLSFYLYGTTEKEYNARKAWVEKHIASKNSRTKEENSEQSENPALDFHRRLIERSKKIPQEELDKFPPDYTENLDYYLYGMPKKSPQPSDTAPSVERNAPMATTDAKDKTSKQPDNPGLPEWYTNTLERSKKLTKEDLEPFPPDFTENLDHYLYGTPKKTP